jgi:hypothetical protein
MATMLDDKLARLRTHRNNIGRYRRLLKTRLTQLSASSLQSAFPKSTRS